MFDSDPVNFHLLDRRALFICIENKNRGSTICHITMIYNGNTSANVGSVRIMYHESTEGLKSKQRKKGNLSIYRHHK